MKIVEKIFGKRNTTNYKTLIENGAIILDVRTTPEFESGNIKGSKNIPLNILANKINELKQFDNIIVCCQSGMRSSNATSMLKQHGIKNVVNAESWLSLQSKIK